MVGFLHESDLLFSCRAKSLSPSSFVNAGAQENGLVGFLISSATQSAKKNDWQSLGGLMLGNPPPDY